MTWHWPIEAGWQAVPVRWSFVRMLRKHGAYKPDYDFVFFCEVNSVKSQKKPFHKIFNSPNLIRAFSRTDINGVAGRRRQCNRRRSSGSYTRSLVAQPCVYYSISCRRILCKHSDLNALLLVKLRFLRFQHQVKIWLQETLTRNEEEMSRERLGAAFNNLSLAGFLKPLLRPTGPGAAVSLSHLLPL